MTDPGIVLGSLAARPVPSPGKGLPHRAPRARHRPLPSIFATVSRG